MKTEETLDCERKIYAATKKMGVFGCFEVTIGWLGKERVDYMTYDTKGVFRCYEIKITKSDFHSPAHNSFLGDLNYYVMPRDLYDEVAGEIPKGIGAFVVDEFSCYCIRKATRRPREVSEEILKNSMIRSLSREVDKILKCDNPHYVDAKRREIQELTRSRDEYRRKYQELMKEKHMRERGINRNEQAI